MSQPKILPTDTRAFELIDIEQRAWKEQLLNSIFMEHEAKIIKTIPLSPRLLEDKVIWVGNKTRIVSMKSVFKVAMSTIVGQERGTSVHPVWRYSRIGYGIAGSQTN
jgi:AAA+ superfamily predicted ATPase